MEPLTKYVAAGLTGVFALITIPASIYTVSPSEMANVRRNKHVLYEEPVGKGPHLKIPFFDQVDRLQVTLRTIHLPSFGVKTLDNQAVTLDMNFNYEVPKESVNKLLYGIGKGGSAAIDNSIIKVAQGRANRIMNGYNTIDIAEKREEIQKAISDGVFADVKEQFGIEPHSLQFAKIIYPDTFTKSNEATIRSQNEAASETVNAKIKKSEADQAVILATGEARANSERARGESQSRIIVAEAKKTAKVSIAEGEFKRTQSLMEPFGTVETFNNYMKAQERLKWDGQKPMVEMGTSATGNTSATLETSKTPIIKAASLTAPKSLPTVELERSVAPLSAPKP